MNDAQTIFDEYGMNGELEKIDIPKNEETTKHESEESTTEETTTTSEQTTTNEQTTSAESTVKEEKIATESKISSEENGTESITENSATMSEVVYGNEVVEFETKNGIILSLTEVCLYQA